MNKIINVQKLFFLLFGISILACNPSRKMVKEKNTSIEKKYQLPYNLSSPDTKKELPPSLNEISGLTLIQGKGLLAIQDEIGNLYYITNDGVKDFPFRDKGDYEGVEIVGEEVYVVKSSGTMYRIKNWGTENQEVIKMKFFLTKEYDVEGLCYDKETHSLLLACKDAPDGKTIRSVFQFDLATQQLKEEPLFNINIPTIVERIKKMAPTHAGFQKLLEDKGNKVTYSPSAIAIHPKTGHIYITSSKGKMLLVLNRKGEFIHLEKLEKKIHNQPEGLCFDKEGNLYISNESKSNPPLLYMFKMKK